MEAKPQRRHHYIPAFLVKRFCDDAGMLWYGIRDSQKITRLSRRNAFVEKDLYTSYETVHEVDNDFVSEPDDRYERDLANFEAQAALAIEMLISGVDYYLSTGRTDRLRNMPEDAVLTCKQLLINIMNRTPDAMKAAIARARPDAMKAIEKHDRQQIERLPNRSQDTLFRNMGQSAMANAVANFRRHIPRGYDLHSYCLEVALHSRLKGTFIVGSRGVADLVDTKYGGHWLPISPPMAIALDAPPDKITLWKNEESLCRRINTTLARDSDYIGGVSKEQLECIMKKQWGMGNPASE